MNQPFIYLYFNLRFRAVSRIAVCKRGCVRTLARTLLACPLALHKVVVCLGPWQVCTLDSLRTPPTDIISTGEDKEARADIKRGRIATNALLVPKDQTKGNKLILMSQVVRQTVGRVRTD